MKKIFVLLLLLFLVFFISTDCFALSDKSNGYDWNSSAYSERIEYCKSVSQRIGKDFLWWFGAYTSLYDTTENGVLYLKLGEAAVLLPAFE